MFSNSTEEDNDTECQSLETAYPDTVDVIWVRVMFGIFYTVIWLLGVIGNSLILYMVLKKKASFTVRTVFITSLAGSDLMIAFVSLPVTAVTAFTRVWPFTEVMCRTVAFFQASSVFISSFTLTAIAVDRFYLILYPSSLYITYERARIIVFFIWVIGYGFASPLIVYMKLSPWSDKICGLFCDEAWPPETKEFYGISVLILQFALPVLISSYCYASISRRLAQQIAVRKRTTILPEAERRLINRRRRTNLMMSSMVVFFVLAWSPLNIINVIRDFELVDLKNFELLNIVFILCHLAAMTSIVWNPIIYSFFNESFRAAIENWFSPVTVWYKKLSSS